MSLRLVIDYPDAAPHARSAVQTVRYRVIQSSPASSTDASAWRGSSCCDWKWICKLVVLHILLAWGLFSVSSLQYQYATYSIDSPPSVLYTLVSLFFCYFTARFLLSSPSPLSSAYEESILFIPGFGFQFESANYEEDTTASSSIQRQIHGGFIEQSLVEDVLINEGIQHAAIKFYLMFILHPQQTNGKPKILLPFRKLQPRFEILQQIYQHLSESFHGSK